MRLEQFYEFCKVVETGSLRKASEKFYTTPQNVSKSMIQLEQELGVVLYDRVPKGVAVTTEGKIVYDSMKRVIEEIDGMKAALGAKSGGTDASRPVMVYCCPALSVFVNKSMVDAFVKDPKTQIKLSQKTRGDLNDIVKNSRDGVGLPDVILSSDDEGELAAIRKARSRDYCGFLLYQDKVCLQVSENSELCEAESVSWGDIAKLPLLIVEEPGEQGGIEQQFKEAGYELQNVSYCADVELSSKMARDAGVFTFVSYPSVTMRPLQGVCYIPLEPEISLAAYMLVRKTLKNNLFADILQDEIGKKKAIERFF